MSENNKHNDKVFIGLKNLKSGLKSEMIGMYDLIFNQNKIEFVFSDGHTLPYKEFLASQYDYQVIVKVMSFD